ncbi:MAG: hypothetical protein ACPHQ9_07935 [Marinobacter sp.]|uniref:hypothetical protein n=1 Tax=Marinobacter sp. TaxID=50741 RepID=UPI003C490A17
MNRTDTNERRKEGRGVRFTGKSKDEENSEQKDKSGKKGRKDDTVLGGINDDPKKKKSR